MDKCGSHKVQTFQNFLLSVMLSLETIFQEKNNLVDLKKGCKTHHDK